MIGLRRATFGWYRAVLAPNTITGVISVVFAGMAVVALVLHYAFVGRWAARLADFSPALVWANFSISVLAGGYGLGRAIAFHPALDYRYHEWLKASPWAPGAPLPKGPITPVWQDGLFLLLATLLTTMHASQTPSPALASLGPAIGMSAGLAIGWTLANLVTRSLAAVYATVLAMPAAAMLLEGFTDVGVAVGLVAAAGVAYAGVVKAMHGYPWQVFPRDKNYLKKVTNPRNERGVNWQATATVGWPYTQLLEPPKEICVSRLRAAAEVAIAVVWIAYVARFFPPRDKEAVWVFLPHFAIFLCILKLLINSFAMCPKLCLGERFAKRRPIVWRHDRLLLEALAIPLAMAAVAGVWWRLGGFPNWSGAAATAAVGVWLTRRLGRPIAERFYTGPQMVSGVKPQQAFFKRLASPGE